MFTIVSQQAAVHLGHFFGIIYFLLSSATKNSEQLFDVTSKLVGEQTEIQGITLIDWQENPWKRTFVLTDQAVQLSTAKAYVISDSVLCMGRISENPRRAWKEKTDWWMNSSQCRDLDRIDGKPMEFEWDFFRIHIIADSRRHPGHDDCDSVWTRAIPRTVHLHVNV